MFPAEFDYHRAGSVDEAVELLGRHQGARLLAGGHSLIPMMKLRLAQPPALIDIGRIGSLRGIEEGDGSIRIGALTTHAELYASQLLRRQCPIVAEAAGKIADPQVRNKGTIGGNIAHADPASDLPAVLVAVEASVGVRGPKGSRRIPAAEFFVDLMTTAIGPQEILTDILVPTLGKGTGSAYLKVEHPASGYALCGAAALVEVGGDGTCRRASLCFNGITATPLQASAVAEDLVGKQLDEGVLRSAVEARLRVSDPLADAYASGEYRVQLARVYGRRALAEAAQRAA